MKTISHLFKPEYFFLALATLLLSSTSWASCPIIEGKYTYTCDVSRDDDAVFGKALEASGDMLVQQRSCEEYTFINFNTQAQGFLELMDGRDSAGRTRAKIFTSNIDKIDFKTLAHVPAGSLKAWITKIQIKTNHNGFTLEGKEKARTLVFFGGVHSKFDCKFTRQ